MDTAASLAFFQNFYTDVSLYVVDEPTPAAHPVEEAAVIPAPVVAAVPPAAAASQAPAAPAVAASPVVAEAPAAPKEAAAKLPSLANLALPTTPAAPEKPSPAPAMAEPARTPVVLQLADLPAAAAAPTAPKGRIQPTPTESPVAHIPFSTLGSNAAGLIILVRLPAEEFKKLPRNVFLNNILKAIRLVIEDVVLVNVEHASYPVALCSLRQNLAARQFLAFGKNLLDVAVYTTQPYEPVLLYGDTAFLGASEISMLEYDAGRKKQLWQAMQRMFLS